MNYLADKDLRDMIQAATSKSESYNYFTRWASFGGQGISAENNRDEQRKLIKYNHLVASCVCFYNVFAINQVLNDLKDENVSINPGALSAISPYITRHINRFGEYQLDLEEEISDLNTARQAMNKLSGGFYTKRRHSPTRCIGKPRKVTSLAGDAASA